MAFTATVYNQNCLNAWNVAWNTIANTWGAVNAGTLTAHWVPGAAPNGGAIVITGIATASPIGTSSITSYVREAYIGAKFPLQYLAGPGFGTIAQAYSGGAGTLAQPEEYVNCLQDLWQEMVIDLCQVTAVNRLALAKIHPSDAQQAIAVGICIAVNAADCWPWVASVRNTNVHLYPNGTRGGYGSVSQTTLIVPTTAQVSENSEVMMPDVDIAINNGSAIFSVMSQSFTFPEG